MAYVGVGKAERVGSNPAILVLFISKEQVLYLEGKKYWQQVYQSKKTKESCFHRCLVHPKIPSVVLVRLAY